MPVHLISTGSPSSIFSVVISSSDLGPEGVKVIFATLEEPAGTSSKAGEGTNTPEPLVIHLNLAVAFPVLVITICSVQDISRESSGKENFKTFFETSSVTGSA
jgi:hypothetical protein